MPQTYTPIATYTATANVSTFTFSSIPSTYTDLIISASLKNNTGAGYNLFIRFNGDTGSNYSTTELWGTGSAAGSSRTTNAVYAQLMRNDNSNFSGSTVSIQNYSNTTTNKTGISRTSSTNSPSVFLSLWRSTAAINSITFLQESPANIVAGSTLTLYGVKSA
jgi:hypothetical protein